MEDKRQHPLFPTNWMVRFLCGCRKQNKAISIHQGIAHRISTHGVRILSDHPICQQKTIAMQLMIPSPLTDTPQKIVKVIGNSIATVMQEEKFLAEIEFLHFEEGGLAELDRNLRQRFDTRLIA